MNALPLPLPAVSRGFTALTPLARAEGIRIAGAIASALSDVLGDPVRIAARALPGPAIPATGVARATVALGGVSASATLEVDAGLLARTLERLSTRPARTHAALVTSDVEESLLGLLTLVAIEAVASPDDPLVPRLAVDGRPPPDALAVALDLGVADDRGRGQLLLPASAVAALGGCAELPPAMVHVGIGASLRQGTVSLRSDDLAALAPGDAVLLDAAPSCSELVLPGGLALRGRTEDDVFHVEEIRMTETQAAYPIALSVEIARVTVTLGELARVNVGAALVLDARKDGAVVLRAGEHAVARGQLVDVEGALGVRITHVGPLP